MANMNVEQMVEELSSWSVMDVSTLVKALEEKWGVSAAPVAVAGAGGGAAPAEAAEEKTEWTVELTDVGGKKIQVIKAVREVTSLGLADAKNLVEAAPKAIKEDISKEEAEMIQKKLEEAEPPKRDLKMETLVGLMKGELLGHVHCYRADDMLNMLQLADEFGFKIRSFHHAVEAYKIRDVLAERDVSVSTWADWWGFKMEAYDAIQENAALLAEVGGKPIIHSDSARGIRRLNQETAKAMAHGRRAGIEVSENEALRWITYNAAWALGIEEDVGTLEPGKRADIVVWDGAPFSVYSSPRWVFVDGVLRHDSEGPSTPWSDFEVGQEVQP